MPLYEYQCEACGTRFELIRKFSDPPVETCPTCGKGPVAKLVSSPAFQFKGSGWYITDYARKGDSSTSSSESKAEKAGEKPAGATDSSGSSGTGSKDTGSTEKPSKPAATGSTKES